MSPRKIAHASPKVLSEVGRVATTFGVRVRDARIGRGWTVLELATRASVSADAIYRIEAGAPASTEMAVRLAIALDRRLEMDLADPRRRAGRVSLAVDVVHSAMGEFEAAHMRRLGIQVGIDEPYQHYQFAGRADLVAWDLDRRALLHIENRTRFPDFQEMAGAYNAKRAYLAAAIGLRVGVRDWASETHGIAALWSAEVLHALRLRTESFRALCPDDATAVDGWWSGTPPARGRTSTLIVLDPLASGRLRRYTDLDHALVARPRHRGYADLAALLDRAA
ncbi:MAG TPA: helix-turn-helix transcriptional regulator [Candidatus Limnocylindrales bacterium]|nr:helix-turn-helix transcriptional regulator [Candidatus Limnocylindrales bacterium]